MKAQQENRELYPQTKQTFQDQITQLLSYEKETSVGLRHELACCLEALKTMDRRL